MKVEISQNKPPLTYYGGKQKMLKHIIPLTPEHVVYNEPFFGRWGKSIQFMQIL